MDKILSIMAYSRQEPNNKEELQFFSTMGTLLRIASRWLHWINNHAAAQLSLEKKLSRKGGMIYSNTYPPKKLSVNYIFHSSPEKQDLSDFLSQWCLKYKSVKTKKQ